MKRTIILTLLMLTSFSSQSLDKSTELDAVRTAAMDYILAIYQVKPELVERSVHKELVKLGFYVQEDAYVSASMTYEELVKLAGTYNKDGKNIADDAPKKVEVLDISNQTASVKVTASWGIDYMHLAKYQDQWKIIHVLWQSAPKDWK